VSQRHRKKGTEIERRNGQKKQGKIRKRHGKKDIIKII